MTFEQARSGQPFLFVSFSLTPPSSMTFLSIASALSAFLPPLPCLCLPNSVTVTLLSASDASFSPWLWRGGRTADSTTAAQCQGTAQQTGQQTYKYPSKEDCISVNKAPEHGRGFSVLSRSAEGCAGQRIIDRI